MAQSFDLFGNKKHKTRIGELEQQIRELHAENQKLKTRVDKRDKKTKTAVTRKQEVEEVLNRAQQRITTLENELTVLREESSKNITFSGTYPLNRSRLTNMVFELGSMRSKPGTFHSIYLNTNARTSDFEFGDTIDADCIHLFDQIRSYNGKVLFYDEDHCISVAVVPPFVIESSDWTTADAFDLTPLEVMLAHSSTVCTLYAHAGRTVIGIVRGGGIGAGVGGDRDDDGGSEVYAEIVRTGVQAKHTKGGWSQRRFERGRDQDVDYHIKKVQEKLESMIDNQVETIIAGGDLSLTRKVLAGVKVPVIEKRVDVDGNPEDVTLKVVWAGRLYRL
ncbi:MAG: Peptide chain release factor subunit 1 [Candidatus Methanogaster sp.]|nr:MAG: Peptide chain release factor subunit 1 [ANME-2 cluster archaeon]